MIIKNRLVILFSLFSIQGVQADEYSFKEYVDQVNKHSQVMSTKLHSQALSEKASEMGSWGDPMLQVAAVNFPKDSLSSKETPMTGIKYSLMQKVSLTNKFGNMEDAFKLVAKAKDMDSEDQKRVLLVTVWKLGIFKKKAQSNLKILQENKNWIEKMLAISKKLYTNGKIAQQALLDIQIRRSNLETMIFNGETELKEIDAKLSYFLESADGKSSLSLESIPWGILNNAVEESNEGEDFKERSLELKLKGKELMLSASKKNFLPDVTIGLSYTKRSNIDKKGDFVGASLTFPLPFSSKKYSSYGEAVKEKQQAQYLYREYKQKKDARLKELDLIVLRSQNELDVLVKETKNFALNSREITSKSYRFGKSTYFELLKSELQLQDILMKENLLLARLEQAKLEKLYLMGAMLHE